MQVTTLEMLIQYFSHVEYQESNTLFIAHAAESDRFAPVKPGGGFQKHLGTVVGLRSSLDIPPAGGGLIERTSPDHGEGEAPVEVFIIT